MIKKVCPLCNRDIEPVWVSLCDYCGKEIPANSQQNMVSIRIEDGLGVWSQSVLHTSCLVDWSKSRSNPQEYKLEKEHR